MAFEIPELVSEIVVNVGGIESIPKHELKTHFDNWHKALSKMGQLKIYYSDTYALANKLISEKISLQEFEETILKSGWQHLWGMHTLIHILQQSGFQILTTNYHDTFGVINAQKNTTNLSI
jgi:hypothetical protein